MPQSFPQRQDACSTILIVRRPAIRLVLTSTGQQEAIIGLERASEGVTPPLLRLEHALQGFSAFVVMPLFALSNAGVSLGGIVGRQVMLAVILGLTIGKPLGIIGAAMAAVRLRLAALPEGVTWTALHGCAWLGGIGFTMSLFIATLAFEGTNLLDSAKMGFSGVRCSRASSARSCCAAELAEAEPRILFGPACSNPGLAYHGHTRRRRSSRRSMSNAHLAQNLELLEWLAFLA